MSHWLNTLSGWLTQHPQWLGGALLLVCFMECLAIVGLLVPGVIVIFVLATLAGSGLLSLELTLILGFVGGLSGDLCSYALGRHQQVRLRNLSLLRRHPEWLNLAEQYVQHYGAASLLVGRFIGPLRPMLPLAAGMLNMPWLRFTLVSLMASAGWALAYLAPGWLAGAALRLPLESPFWYQAGGVLGGLILLAITALYCRMRHWPHTAEAMAVLSGLSLLGLLTQWPHFMALDHGLLALIQAQRTALLNAFMVVVTLVGDYWLQLLAGCLVVSVLALHRHWSGALFALLTLVGTGVSNQLLKQSIARGRPEILQDPLPTYSLPSGHSSAAYALSFTLAMLACHRLAPRTQLTGMLLALLPPTVIALSRSYLGVHWPTDLLGGLLLATCICSANLALLRRTWPLQPVPSRVWWMLLPSLLILITGYCIWQYPDALHRYQVGH